MLSQHLMKIDGTNCYNQFKLLRFEVVHKTVFPPQNFDKICITIKENEQKAIKIPLVHFG